MEPVDYELMTARLAALCDGIDFEITNLSNAAALIYETIPELNWAGFYLYRNRELWLGPFQGKTACTRIAMGRGVCGTAAKEGTSLVVADVHQFPGHIACDCASNSEIVIPIYRRGNRDELFGVLDLDSPLTGRFTETEKGGLEQFVRKLEEFL